jgi:hypothetical protein
MKKSIKLSIVGAMLLFSGCDFDFDSESDFGAKNNDIQLTKTADLNLTQDDDDITEVTAEDMVLSKDGKSIFLADGSAGLKVIDVQDASNPKIIGHYDDSSDRGVNRGGFARRIAIANNSDIVYIADGLAGLKIIDVSNPAKPKEMSQQDTKGFSHGITVSSDDKYVYVADNGEDGGTPGLRVFDVSDPYAPFMITERSEQWATQVALSSNGERLYVTDKKAGIMVTNTSDISSFNGGAGDFNATRLGKYIVTDKGISADIILSPDETKAYVANKKPGIKILDISDASNPTLIAKYDGDGFDGKSIAKSITLSKDGKRLYIANRKTGVEVIDVSNATAPKKLASIKTSSAEDVLLSKDEKYIYVADGKAGFKVISITK